MNNINKAFDQAQPKDFTEYFDLAPGLPIDKVILEIHRVTGESEFQYIIDNDLVYWENTDGTKSVVYKDIKGTHRIAVINI